MLVFADVVVVLVLLFCSLLFSPLLGPLLVLSWSSLGPLLPPHRPVERLQILDVNPVNKASRLPIKPVHDAPVLVKRVDDGLGDAGKGGGEEDDLVVLGEGGEEVVDSGTLGVTPTVLAVPGGGD